MYFPVYILLLKTALWKSRSVTYFSRSRVCPVPSFSTEGSLFNHINVLTSESIEKSSYQLFNSI